MVDLDTTLGALLLLAWSAADAQGAERVATTEKATRCNQNFPTDHAAKETLHLF